MSYKFIKRVMKTVLAKSPTIKDRFYILPKYLQELNSSDLEQLTSNGAIQNAKAGPLVAMMPPTAFGRFRDGHNAWTRYACTAYFLRTSYADENGVVRSPSPMNTTTVLLEDDWEAMQKVAVDSLKLMDKWFKDGMYDSKPMVNKIRFRSNTEHAISPISLQGNDRRSGVKVSFQLEINDGCDTTEYSNDSVEALLNTDLNS